MIESSDALRLFRAVSREEEEDIRHFDGIRFASGTMETKLFTLSGEDAAAMGRLLFVFDRRPFYIVEARIPRLMEHLVEMMEADGYEVAAVSPERIPEFNRVASFQTWLMVPCGNLDA